MFPWSIKGGNKPASKCKIGQTAMKCALRDGTPSPRHAKWRHQSGFTGELSPGGQHKLSRQPLHYDLGVLIYARQNPPVPVRLRGHSMAAMQSLGYQCVAALRLPGHPISGCPLSVQASAQ